MNYYPLNPMGINQTSFNPYLSQLPVNPVIPNYTPVTTQGPKMEIQRVNGKESAMSFPIGPNSSVILADATKPKIWVVTTDASGFRAVNGFKITPDDEEEPVVVTADDQMKAMEERLSKLEERMNAYGKPNYRADDQNESGNAESRSNGRGVQGCSKSTGNTAANECG